MVVEHTQGPRNVSDAEEEAVVENMGQSDCF